MESLRRINLTHMRPMLSSMAVERLFEHLLDQVYQEKSTNTRGSCKTQAQPIFE